MKIRNEKIDDGKAFDWGRTSKDYAKYRDIYPDEFFQKILERNLCIKGQHVLDLGTGTGILPRNMYQYGANFKGTDISENQIEQAVRLSEAENMKIQYEVAAAEDISDPENSYDVITACQCFFYFEHNAVMPKLASLLKADGRLLILYMAWLPYEDKVAKASEELILKYNPSWSGSGETRHPIPLPDCANDSFTLEYQEIYDLQVPFTRESWNGRMRACRGVGASLNQEQIAEWEKEHMSLLNAIAPEKFSILHYAVLAELKPLK